MSPKLKYWIGLLSLGYMGGTIYLLPYIRYSFYTQMQETILSGGEPITNTQMGLLGLVFSWITSVSMIIGGYMADRWDAKRILILSVGSTTLVTFIHAIFIHSYTVALVVWALMGITTGFAYWPALQKFIFTLGNLDEAAISYGRYYLINGLSGALGNFIPLWVCEQLGFGYKGCVWTVGIITLIATILVVLFLESEADKIARGVEIPKEEPLKLKEVPKILIWPGFWLWWLVGTFAYWLYAHIAYLTPYLVDVMGMDPGTSSLFSTFRTYVAMAAAPLGGLMADKILKSTSSWFIVGCAIISVLLIGLFLFKPGSALMMVGVYSVIPALIIMPVYSQQNTIYRETGLPQSALGTAIGVGAIIGAVLPLVDGLVPVFYGHWLDKYGNTGYTYIIWSLIAISVLLIIIGILVKIWYKAVNNGKVAFRKGEAAEEAPEEAAE